MREQGSNVCNAAYATIGNYLVTPTTPPISAVTLSVSPNSPVNTGTLVSLNASATGGLTPEYRFYALYPVSGTNQTCSFKTIRPAVVHLDPCRGRRLHAGRVRARTRLGGRLYRLRHRGQLRGLPIAQVTVTASEQSTPPGYVIVPGGVLCNSGQVDRATQNCTLCYALSVSYRVGGGGGEVMRRTQRPLDFPAVGIAGVAGRHGGKSRDGG